MKQKVRGHAFRLVGLILGIIGATVSITSIVFAALGLHQARLCKHCEKGEKFPVKYTKEEMLSKVDHTLLKPEATWPQIRTLCDEAIANHCASVCINTSLRQAGRRVYGGPRAGLLRRWLPPRRYGHQKQGV